MEGNMNNMLLAVGVMVGFFVAGMILGRFKKRR